MPQNREREIEDAVIAHPEILGFPNAAAIRNVRVGWRFGRIDVMLLPRSGSAKLVLIEAKHSSAPDAICKVIGQLLMYYTGALNIGADGLACFRKYADSHPEPALSASWISPKQLTGGISPPSAAWAKIQSGEKLRPAEVRLFIALNAVPHDALCGALTILTEHHHLPIGLLSVKNGIPQLFVIPRAA